MMKKLISLGLAAMLCGAGFSAAAQTGVRSAVPAGVAAKDGMPMKDGAAMHGDMSMGMKTMDANGDGMISKAKYDKHHSTMWMKKKGQERHGHHGRHGLGEPATQLTPRAAGSWTPMGALKPAAA